MSTPALEKQGLRVCFPTGCHRTCVTPREGHAAESGRVGLCLANLLVRIQGEPDPGTLALVMCSKQERGTCPRCSQVPLLQPPGASAESVRVGGVHGPSLGRCWTWGRRYTWGQEAVP